MEPERRYLAVSDLGDEGLGLEERDGSPPKLRGIAPPWNSLSVDLGGFREQFSPSAFDRILSRSKNDPRPKPDVVGLFNHDDSLLLARTTNGTLRLSKEDRGLGWEMSDLPDTQAARDVLALVRAGLVTGASFAFTVADKGEHWTQDEKGNAVRTITDANLFDVSVVTRPAYPSSSVGLRSLEAWKQARGVVEHRSAGGLTIALDFDRTFTAAPGLWRSFISDATNRGARVVCITRRENTDENAAEIREAFASDFEALAGLVMCGTGTQKRDAAKAAGLDVDIWIDDTPETIPSAAAEPRAVKVSTLVGARAAAAAAVARMRANARPR
jgi:HK97 family phage prohead protease